MEGNNKLTKYATVFGAARMKSDCKEYLDTVKIGEILAEKGYCVCHGGYTGVMEAVAKGCQNKDGINYGFGCTEISSRFNDYCTRTALYHNLFDRLETLIESSSVFIVQCGGIGTLAELALTLDYYRKQDNKPQIYLIGDYWKPIIDMDFIPKSCKNMIRFIIDINELELLLL